MRLYALMSTVYTPDEFSRLGIIFQVTPLVNAIMEIASSSFEFLSENRHNSHSSPARYIYEYRAARHAELGGEGGLCNSSFELSTWR